MREPSYGLANACYVVGISTADSPFTGDLHQGISVSGGPFYFDSIPSSNHTDPPQIPEADPAKANTNKWPWPNANREDTKIRLISIINPQSDISIRHQ